MAEPTPTKINAELIAGASPIATELRKPERYLTGDEVIQFLGLRNKSALAYLMAQPDPPPYIRLTKRTRAFPFRQLVAWAEARITTRSLK